MKIWLGPVGRISRGHVLDCAKVHLERKLRELDSQLYVCWNPRKLKGHGCWEIRRRPEFKIIKEELEVDGATIKVLDYVENNFDNHVLDLAFLNYNVITKLQSMDTWNVSRNGEKFMNEMEYRANKHKTEKEASALAERRYELKQQRTMIRDLMDYTLSGGDPANIANHWNQ